MAEAPSTLLPPLLPSFLSFKRPFKSEGWEDFLLREGTSLIWASSPSTFLTRDPFKASGPPWRWHPWCSTLCVSGCQTPWSFFFPPLSSHLTLLALLLVVTCCLPLQRPHRNTHTFSGDLADLQRDRPLTSALNYICLSGATFFFCCRVLRAWSTAAISLRQGTFQE